MDEIINEILDGLPRISEYVFCYKTDGKPYLRRFKTIQAACKKAKVKEFGYHSLRHYGASKLAETGVSIPDIQALLGHQRATTTDIYLCSRFPQVCGRRWTISIPSPS